jgi:hypothetical protein
LNDDLPTNLRPVADFFGLVGTPPVEKDFHVVRAIRALAALDAAPYRLVFAGGTALARAHKLIRRMSEDVDFKVGGAGPNELGGLVRTSRQNENRQPVGKPPSLSFRTLSHSDRVLRT